MSSNSETGFKVGDLVRIIGQGRNIYNKFSIVIADKEDGAIRTSCLIQRLDGLGTLWRKLDQLEYHPDNNPVYEKVTKRKRKIIF